MIEPSPPTSVEPLTVSQIVRGSIVLGIVGFIAVHILCFLWHYVPWLDSKVSKGFGEPPRKEVVYLIATPTPTVTPSPTSVPR